MGGFDESSAEGTYFYKMSKKMTFLSVRYTINPHLGVEVMIAMGLQVAPCSFLMLLISVK
jgi:hypothetical protein